MTRRDRLWIAVAVASAAAAILWLDRDELMAQRLAPLTALTADLLYGLIVAFGLEATRAGNVIAHAGGFACEVYYRCIGLAPAVLLSVAMLASPACGRHKLAGLAVGVPLVLAVNLLRLASLFALGSVSPQHVAFAHDVAWQVGMAATVLAIWSAWMRWQRRRPWRRFGSGSAVI